MPPTNSNPINPYIYSAPPVKSTSFWRRKPIMIGLPVLILVIIVAIILVAVSSKTPKSIANKFVEEMLNNQTTQTYQQASSNLRSSISLSNWKLEVKSIDGICIGKIYYASSYVKSLNAQEIFKVGNSNKENCSIDIGLIHSSGNWYVNSLTASA